MGNEQQTNQPESLGRQNLRYLKRILQLEQIADQAERIIKERDDPHNLAPPTSFEILKVHLKNAGYLIDDT